MQTHDIKTTITRNGITLTVDFVNNDEVFYKKYNEKPDGEADSLESDWNRFVGAFRVPISQWIAQTS
jgi:hypothetical protein